jgi:glucokinase
VSLEGTVVLADLGGTRLKAGRLGRVHGGPEHVVEHGGDWRGALREAVRVLGGQELALCVPGLVDGGRVCSLPGKLPGLQDADLAGAAGVPVVLLVNDAVAYAVGEALAGAGRGAARVAAVTIGTGIGVAVVEDGRPLGRGPLGAGVLGGGLPLPGPVDGPLDSAGRPGTFEARCQAASLVAAVPGAADVASAYALFKAGVPAAVEGFSDYRRWLARGLGALCAAHAPDVVVVGGGAARPPLLDGLEGLVRDRLWPGQAVQVRRAQLGDAAALAGLRLLLRTAVAA